MFNFERPKVSQNQIITLVTSSARNRENEEQNVLLYMSTTMTKVTPQYEVNHVIMAEPTLA